MEIWQPAFQDLQQHPQIDLLEWNQMYLMQQLDIEANPWPTK